MAKKSPLELLKCGLAKLKSGIKERADILRACLAREEKISSEDEDWLDNSGNLVDEQAVVDRLDDTSDYERSLQRLNSREQAIVKTLLETAGAIAKTVTGKRKRVSPR